MTTKDGSSDMETAPDGGALAKNPTFSMSDSLDGHRHWDLRLENQPFNGTDPSLRLCQSYVQPTSENEAPSRLAWDTRQRFRHIDVPYHNTNSSPGESEQDPMAYMGEACSGDQKASDGDQPDNPPLPTPAWRNSPDRAIDTPKKTHLGSRLLKS